MGLDNMTTSCGRAFKLHRILLLGQDTDGVINVLKQELASVFDDLDTAISKVDAGRQMISNVRMGFDL